MFCSNMKEDCMKLITDYTESVDCRKSSEEPKVESQKQPIPKRDQSCLEGEQKKLKILKSVVEK